MSRLKIKQPFSSALLFCLLAVILFWIKSYITYKFAFTLGIENGAQSFLLLLNPLSATLFFIGLGLFAKGRRAFIWMILADFLLSLLLYCNVVYYREFADFITVPTMLQSSNLGDMGGSIMALMRPVDFLVFTDVVLLILLLVFKVFVPNKAVRVRPRKTLGILTLAVALFAANLSLAEIDRPQLLSRGFDNNYVVKYLGMTNFMLFDTYRTAKSTKEKASASGTDTQQALDFTKKNYAVPNEKYFGIAKNKNVIYIHLESFQQYLVNFKLNGEEVTPNINKFFKDKETIAFDNYFHQVGQGKTSDAEMMLENSLYGLASGSAFTSKGDNVYQSQPAILGHHGYDSAVFHGNTRSFWNRDAVYKEFGIKNFFDSSYYDMNENDTLNYGLKDKPFFTESIPMLETLKQPFYAKFITLSNHFPYPISAEDATIDGANSGDSTVDGSFQTARYLDEALGQFMTYLKKSGLYDNSVIVMYGDHYGTSDNRSDALGKVLGDDDVTDFDVAQLQRVPLMIHVPGVDGFVDHSYGGQVDTLPTVLHLLGIDSKDYLQFGTDLLSTTHNQTIPFRNGNFVSNTVSYIGGKYYDQKTGTVLTDEQVTDEMKEQHNYVNNVLGFSDKVLQQDLLRFYTPEGFTPTKRSDYTYGNNSTTAKKTDTKDEK
ncbi:LTA synthase family protein [Brochothrix campestris]|uniref:Sulfatase N-terminal domain-containing protein n=1 Tax=Brochothrix campestris FSL F6-1037 TaxID=1265861 RepID=W7CSK5_9LIST|nr:LTA synthase family protein [Brochothrix campestris]EUJ39857.1 hypothetical protein BCAMP_06635 [Brochothrix campestris FSL F6-1037]